MTPEEFSGIVAVIREASTEGFAPGPRLLFTEDKLREVRKLQAMLTFLPPCDTFYVIT